MLRPSAVLTGQVATPDDEPLAGAHVTVSRSVVVGTWRCGARRMRVQLLGRTGLLRERRDLSHLAFVTRTDALGRFRLEVPRRSIGQLVVGRRGEPSLLASGFVLGHAAAHDFGLLVPTLPMTAVLPGRDPLADVFQGGLMLDPVSGEPVPLALPPRPER